MRCQERYVILTWPVKPWRPGGSETSQDEDRGLKPRLVPLNFSKFVCGMVMNWPVNLTVHIGKQQRSKIMVWLWLNCNSSCRYPKNICRATRHQNNSSNVHAIAHALNNSENVLRMKMSLHSKWLRSIFYRTLHLRSAHELNFVVHWRWAVPR